jgi:hypothetical protein
VPDNPIRPFVAALSFRVTAPIDRKSLQFFAARPGRRVVFTPNLT